MSFPAPTKYIVCFGFALYRNVSLLPPFLNPLNNFSALSDVLLPAGLSFILTSENCIFIASIELVSVGCETSNRYVTSPETVWVAGSMRKLAWTVLKSTFWVCCATSRFAAKRKAKHIFIMGHLSKVTKVLTKREDSLFSIL